MESSLTNPYESLQIISNRQLTGCLSITLPNEAIGWKLYIGGSRLYFATASRYSPERLGLLWQQMKPDMPLPKLSASKPEYDSLYEWQLEHDIPLIDFRRLLLSLSREALIQSISHTQTYVKFEENLCVKPPLIAAPISDLVSPVINHVHFWRKIHKYIPSPFSRVYLDRTKVNNFKNLLESTHNDYASSQGESSAFSNISLATWLDILERKLSVYEICQKIGKEPHALLGWLNPIIVDKTLQVFPSNICEDDVCKNSNSPLIACIDDSHTVQRQVKTVLEMFGFQVLGITDPTTCLTSLVRQKPSLILMDITMPEIDGYELCKMLRQSRHMRSIPIVMFTGKDGIIDRMRAQLVGANDYITKPVNADKLVAKVQRLVQSSKSLGNQSNDVDVMVSSASNHSL